MHAVFVVSELDQSRQAEAEAMLKTQIANLLRRQSSGRQAQHVDLAMR